MSDIVIFARVLVVIGCASFLLGSVISAFDDYAGLHIMVGGTFLLAWAAIEKADGGS